MFAKFKISTKSDIIQVDDNISIPINIKYQLVGNSELIEDKFVKKAIKSSINPILDYEKSKFQPVGTSQSTIRAITYNVNFLVNNVMQTPTNYAQIGFDDSDIRLNKNYFTNGYLMLSFYDSNNPMTQELISETIIYNDLYDGDFTSNGQPTSINNIYVRAVATNPNMNSNRNSIGFYLYDYKDKYVKSGVISSLYVKAEYFNAKTGKFTNLVTTQSPITINNLINNQYVKYNLYRDNNGYFYKIDDTYTTNVIYSNVTLTSQQVVVNFYETNIL